MKVKILGHTSNNNAIRVANLTEHKVLCQEIYAMWPFYRPPLQFRVKDQ